MQNFMKTIISTVQAWTKGKIKESTADWNQNDSNANNYVKNRTHWEETKETVLVPKTVFEFDNTENPFITLPYTPSLAVRQEYVITYDDVKYNCIAYQSSDGGVSLGNGNLFVLGENSGDGNGEPFFFVNYNSDFSAIFPAEVGSHAISIAGKTVVVHKLDSKYLNLPTNLATTDDVQDVSDNKMDKCDPAGVGSFSMNRSASGTVGIFSSVFGMHNKASDPYSHAEGYGTVAGSENRATTESTGILGASHAEGQFSIASGKAAHAEGYATTASGASSHAEGCRSTASGNYAHAEGYQSEAVGPFSHAEGRGTTASGDYSHAEGYATTASGDYSHAEGVATASGNYSHAEGSATASGDYSHAEGLQTIAQRQYQHVQGSHNILDTDGSETTRGKYAHIVGNGASTMARSNAHTLDWNGVGWFQGGLQVGGNAQDDGAQTVMLNGDKEIILASSTEGSTKKFKITVEDNGALTATEIIEETTTE